MAILILGKSVCSLCSRGITESDPVVSFGPFVANQLDPLWRFSDGVFHDQCFRKEPLAHKAIARQEELLRAAAPAGRRCRVCSQRIERPDDYILVPHLTDNPSSSAYDFNYSQFHRSCLRLWPHRVRLLSIIDELSRSGAWRGQALSMLRRELAESWP